MATRVIVNGARGKMGSLACETIKNHPDFELVGALSRHDDLSTAIVNTKAQIVIDLTRADCAYDNTLTIINSGAHPVIGTSGLNLKQIKQLESLCSEKKLGGIIAPNFSISAVLMMKFAAYAARYLSDVEIIEAHHPQKFDAPSGTAMKTAEMIAATRKMTQTEYLSHELITGARGGTHQGITIHSLRLPGIMARQQVIFGAPGETLTLMHDSIDRASFMPGIILCCQRVSELQTLYYGLEHLLT
ncbi:dihydrodipicolinate reductases [Legionella beliardensis]|uniref:4-hydroxy-tetrahydrodipicolinate reductase n=1 Tax=Legionella beliardensis TaxID=91822 RepID=A0A378HYX5_9GAMM|nr:4-hydroxy-tetrahydrodipicolinate reductase [Legionella beliardensis]STX27660.1 dihydrodipicolinate reductases [Legionella beliardensis]